MDLKRHLSKLERTIRPKLELLKWMNKETPLVFLILMWTVFLLIAVVFLVPLFTGHITADDYNIMLSILALIAAMILSIVVVL